MRNVPWQTEEPDPREGPRQQPRRVRKVVFTSLDASPGDDGLAAGTGEERAFRERHGAAPPGELPGWDEVVRPVVPSVDDPVAATRRWGRLAGDLAADAAAGTPSSAAQPGTVLCVFHPGRRCPHVRSGRVSPVCRHRDAVLEGLRLALLGDITPGQLRPWVARRTALDPATQGHELERHVYRCLDWFCHLLVGGSTDVAPSMVVASAQAVATHLELADPPSAVTVCLLMNHHPDIPVPAPLRRKYGSVHQPEGELSS
jgi:hypothetical protein